MRILLAFSCIMDLKIFQIDVKIVFLNNYIHDGVYVGEPPNFLKPSFSNHVFKLKNYMYRFKQASRTWYKQLNKFQLKNKFSGKFDTTLFIHKIDHGILHVQIYLNDINFGATNESLYREFSNMMCSEFQRSMMGEIQYFLGLQIHQSKKGTFTNQAKYYKEFLYRSYMEKLNLISTLTSMS